MNKKNSKWKWLGIGAAVGVGTYFVFRQALLLNYGRIQGSQVSKALEGKSFRKLIDLGCGGGYNAERVRNHASMLVGVDVNAKSLERANATGLYDELVFSDLRTFVLPSDADAVVLLDVIEHMSEHAGLKLLETLKARGVYILLSTPSYYWRNAFPCGEHLSLWTTARLQELGFRAWQVELNTFAEYMPTF